MTKPMKLVVGIGFAGFVCGGLALAIPTPFAWLLAWTALSCFGVAAAYATNWPGVFGKRDGRLSPFRTLLLAPYLLAFRIACLVMRARRKAPVWSEVAPGLYVGARLSGDQLPAGVDYIVDLTCEYSEPAALRELPGYRCVPVLDGAHPPDEEGFTALLAELGAAQGGVLFHCESGKGRAPTAAALTLIARGIVSDPESAVELISKGRPSAAPTRSDFGFMRRVCARLQSVDHPELLR